jgi:hypothetical protein
MTVIAATAGHRRQRSARRVVRRRRCGLVVQRGHLAIGVPGAHQLAQPVLQALHIAAAGVQHPLQAFLLARHDHCSPLRSRARVSAR